MHAPDLHYNLLEAIEPESLVLPLNNAVLAASRYTPSTADPEVMLPLPARPAPTPTG
jgi:hypothetical protein